MSNGGAGRGNVCRKGGHQNRTSANKGEGWEEEGGSKFWSFCENVIIE